MFPANHKTVFVLDHTPYFGASCDSIVELDLPSKPRGLGFIPLAPVTKSLWTAAVEAAIEYCRVVWDLFPTGKLIRFIVSDNQSHSLNTWCQTQQTLNYILHYLAVLGVPPRPPNQSSDYSVIHGLRGAVEAVCQCTSVQHERRTSLTESTNKVINRSRVICITSTQDDASMKALIDHFHSALLETNKRAANSDVLVPVHHCHLVMINAQARNVELPVTPMPPRDISSLLTAEVHSVKAGGNLALKLSHLILSHYDLASTTVTGIPMKEEQNASSSANYDVEIFHRSAAHSAIIKGNAADSALVRTQREGCEYETVTLKWCTPRGASAGEMQHCTSMYRITPVDVNSRPSSCLINFLLNGRSVMLEMARKMGGKILSHMLAAHGGEIFVHALGTSRSVLEDPPSISEGGGGRVTDYRIPDFGVLMQKNILVPLKRKWQEESLDNGDVDDKNAPLNRMRERIGRFTKHWPITISSTFIFNLKPDLEPLLNLLVKETLTKEEVVQCKQVIYSLVKLESKHEPLQPSTGQRSKGPKRDEQYRLMWAELEALIRAHTRTEQHNEILGCLLECRSEDDSKGRAELEQLGSPQAAAAPAAAAAAAAAVSASTGSQRISVIRATTDSPMSPPPMANNVAPLTSGRSSVRHGHSIYNTTPRSILDLFVSRCPDSKANRVDFPGRITSEMGPNGNKMAKLYTHLNSDGSRCESTNASGVEVDS